MQPYATCAYTRKLCNKLQTYNVESSTFAAIPAGAQIDFPFAKAVPNWQPDNPQPSCFDGKAPTLHQSAAKKSEVISKQALKPVDMTW